MFSGTETEFKAWNFLHLAEGVFFLFQKRKKLIKHFLFDLTSVGRQLFKMGSYLTIKIYLKGKFFKISFGFLLVFSPEINVWVEE